MMFRNSYRLLLANFGAFWKDFLYKLLVLGFVVAITIPVMGTIKSLPVLESFFESAEQLFLTFPFSNQSVFFEGLYDLSLTFLNLIRQLFNLHFATGIYLVFLYCLLMPFLFSLSDLAVSEVLYGSMASLTKYNFSASYIKKLVKSLAYSFFNTILNLIFVFLTAFGVFGILYLGITGDVSMLFVPALICLAIIVIMGFKLTLFAGWAPSIIVFNCGVFKGLKKGFIAVGRRFFKTYSSVAMLILLHLLFVSVFGVVSLALLLPLFSVTLIIFQMVMFFGSQGMRYYVDTDTILSPKQLEETDKFEDAKYII